MHEPEHASRLEAGVLIVRGRRTVVLEKGEPIIQDAALAICDGKIAEILPPERVPAGAETADAGDAIVMPGLVDCHAHINEPGRTEWEGFETATAAAIAGGITTVIDMPLNSTPATTSVEALRMKAQVARGRCRADYGFWGGIVPGNARELSAMIDAGAMGFKAFLIDSGVPEFPLVGEAELREAMPRLSARGVPLLVHAELAPGAPAPQGSRRYSDYLASRPRAWENEAIRLLIRLCEETGCRSHVVHLSSSDALPDLAAAKRRGLPITAETCPHYLTFAAEEIADGATQFKCAPPIREKENRERLWAGLAEGIIDFVVSDHSPCVPALKLLEEGDFGRAWGGIASLQLSLPAVWAQARKRGFSVTDLARWMCARPAKFLGLERVKGGIAPGMDADLVFWNPDVALPVEPGMIRHRHPVTPYAGMLLNGAVQATYLRGRKVYDGNGLIGEPEGREL